jgi:hypothetical protein
MKRRDFITLLGGGLAALGARAVISDAAESKFCFAEAALMPSAGIGLLQSSALARRSGASPAH